MFSHRSATDSKSPQVSRTLLSILAVLNNAVVCMASTHPLISKSSSPCTSPFGDFTQSPSYNWYHSHVHVFQFSSKVQVLIFLFAFFQFYSVVSRNSKVLYSAGSLFFVDITSGRLAEIKWSVCISKSQRSLCGSFSWKDSGLCIYHVFVWSNLNFLHNSQWITLPIQLCLVLYSFCANLLHSLIMLLIISSLLSHHLHLQFSGLLSILALM